MIQGRPEPFAQRLRSLDSNIHHAQPARALGRQEPGSPAAPGAVPAFSHKPNWPDQKARFLLGQALGGRRGLVASGGLFSGPRSSWAGLPGRRKGSREKGAEEGQGTPPQELIAQTGQSCPLTSPGPVQSRRRDSREGGEPEGGAGRADGRIRGLAGTRGPLAQLLRQGAAQPSLENLQEWSPTALWGGLAVW